MQVRDVAGHPEGRDVVPERAVSGVRLLPAVDDGVVVEAQVGGAPSELELVRSGRAWRSVVGPGRDLAVHDRMVSRNAAAVTRVGERSWMRGDRAREPRMEAWLSSTPRKRTRHRHHPREARHGRDAQGRRDHGRRHRRAGQDRRGRRRGRGDGAGAGPGRHPRPGRRLPDERPRHDRLDHRDGLDPGDGQGPDRPLRRGAGAAEPGRRLRRRVRGADAGRLREPHRQVGVHGAVRLRRDQPGRGAAPDHRGRGDDPLQGRGRHR